ncbi:hypothetical protein B0T17DRAFT_545866, partial [Bombardia bombarda]
MSSPNPKPRACSWKLRCVSPQISIPLPTSSFDATPSPSCGHYGWSKETLFNPET